MIEAYIHIDIAEEKATKTRVISLPSVTWVVEKHYAQSSRPPLK